MKSVAKRIEEPKAERPARSERRLKTARVGGGGEFDRRGLALAMVDALDDILRHEQSHRAA